MKCKLVGEFYHCRLEPPSRFDGRSFRSVNHDGEVVITIGCPQGKWDDRRQKCTVSTQAQRIMYHKDVCSEHPRCREGRKR